MINFKKDLIEGSKANKLKKTESLKQSSSGSKKIFGEYKTERQDPLKFQKDQEEFLYLYQEENGQMMFLHPLNYKYLQMEYVNTKDLPKEIEVN
jgi:hypothetical protein